MTKTTGIYLADDDRVLKLSTGMVRDGDTPLRISAYSPIGWQLREYSFISRDEAYAWHLAANAQRSAAYYGHNPALLDIEAYVIGPSHESGRFGPQYFWDKAPDTDVRLTVMHVGRKAQDQPADYGLIERLHTLDATICEAMPEQLVHSGRAFLNDLLAAYRKRSPTIDDPVIDLMEQTDHPFACAFGFNDPHRPGGREYVPDNNGDNSDRYSDKDGFRR